MGDMANFAVICRGRRPRRPEKRKPFLQRKMAIKQRIFHRHDITKTPFVIRVAEDVDPYKIKFSPSLINPNLITASRILQIRRSNIFPCRILPTWLRRRGGLR